MLNLPSPEVSTSVDPSSEDSIGTVPEGSSLSEERYRRLFETAQDGILLLTIPEGIVFDANPYFLRLVQSSAERIVGKKLWELGLIADTVANKAMHDELLQSGYVRYDHLDLLAADGHKVPVEFVSNVYQIHDRRVAQCNVRDISERRSIEQALAVEQSKRKLMMFDLVETLGAVVASRDPYTGSHQRRVASLACAIADAMGLSAHQTEGIRIAALVHDIGKISVPVEILTKPGKVTPAEIALLHTHAQVGYDLLKGIDFPWPVAEIVLQHHERMDGSGYPAGLAAEEILIEARILAVSDMVEAMSSQRPYRLPRTIDETLEELSKQSGGLYDPAVVTCCLNIFRSKRFTFPAQSFSA